jgi:hypothetical protein
VQPLRRLLHIKVVPHRSTTGIHYCSNGKPLLACQHNGFLRCYFDTRINFSVSQGIGEKETLGGQVGDVGVAALTLYTSALC